MQSAAHPRSIIAFVCLGIVLTISGCDDDSDEGGGIEPRFSVLQEEIFTPKCTLSSCHSATFHAGELVLEPAQAYAGLTEGAVFQAAASAEGIQRVVAGEAAASFLWLKLQRDLDPKYGTTMPQASGEGLPEADLAAIEAWIEAGAAND